MLAAGAITEERDGWRVAVRFDLEETERRRCQTAVGFGDRSQLGKLEVHGDHGLKLGQAHRKDDALWCPLTPRRALVLCEPGETARLLGAYGRDAVDLTSAMGAIGVAGPSSREMFARFTAIDLRSKVMPVLSFRPGSVARTPGAVLREDEDRWLMLFGAAVGSYIWTVVTDAAAELGGGPVGIDVLAPRQEALASA